MILCVDSEQRFLVNLAFRDVRRFPRYPEGITMVMVSGEVAMKDGVLTSSRQGNALRKRSR